MRFSEILKIGFQMSNFRFTGLISALLIIQLLYSEKTSAVISSIQVTNTKNEATQVTQRNTTNELSQKAKAITVLVTQDETIGSGVIVGRTGSDYYVLTASHVIDSSGSAQIRTSDFSIHGASILVRELPDLDLAILKFNSKSSYQIASFSNISSLSSGVSGTLSQVLISGWNQSPTVTEHSLTCGIVLPDFFSAFLRQDPSAKGYDLAYTNPTRDGMSGGPILDNNGRVVGIHGRAEGGDLDIGTGINLGLSLGIPSWSFLEILKNSSIPITIEETSTFNNYSLDTNELCSTDIIPPSNSAGAVEWANYANSLLRQLRANEALEAYDKAIEENINGELYELWYGRGLTLILQQRFNEASRNFDTALALWEERAALESNERLRIARSSIWRYQGMLQASQGNQREALDSYEHALTITPNNVEVLTLKAGILSNIGESQEALSAYEEAIKLNPRSYSLRMQKIKILVDENQIEEALKYINEIIVYFSEDANIYAMKGALYERLGNSLEAERQYQIVSEITSNNSSSSFSFNLAEIIISNAKMAVGTTSFSDGLSQIIYSLPLDMPFDIGGLIRSIYPSNDDEEYIQFPDIESPEYIDQYLAYLDNIYQEVLEDYSNFSSTDSPTETIRTYSILQALIHKKANGFTVASEELESLQASANRAIHANEEGNHIAYAVRSAFLFHNGNIRAADEDFNKALTSPEVSAYAVRGQVRILLNDTEGGIEDLYLAASAAENEDDADGYYRIMVIIDRFSF